MSCVARSLRAQWQIRGTALAAMALLAVFACAPMFAAIVGMPRRTGRDASMESNQDHREKRG